MNNNARRLHRLLIIGVVAMSCYASGCQYNAVARVPRPNILVQQKATGTYQTDLSGVPAEEVCSKQVALPAFCVSDFRRASAEALDAVLRAHISEQNDGPKYQAKLRVIQFLHFPTSGSSGNGSSSVSISLRWQFELFGPGNKRIAGIARTTVGPMQIVDPRNADLAVQSLLAVIFEDISAELAKSAW